MSWWIVNYIPSWALLIGLISLVAGGAVLIQRYVRRRFPDLKGDAHNDATKFTYGFIGFVYAFFVGFVVSSMRGQNNAADANARAEGAAAVQMARDAVVFDQRIETASGGVCWHMNKPPSSSGPRPGKSSTSGRRRPGQPVQRLRRGSAKDGHPENPARHILRQPRQDQPSTHGASVTARELAGLPWPFWAVILLTSAMVLGTVIIYGVEKPIIHYPMVAIVAVIVATNLFLVLELAHPYVGAVSTSSDPLQQVVAVLSQAAP